MGRRKEREGGNSVVLFQSQGQKLGAGWIHEVISLISHNASSEEVTVRYSEGILPYRAIRYAIIKFIQRER